MGAFARTMFALAATAFIAVLNPLPVFAQALEAAAEFDITPGPLEVALRKVAQERNLQILFAPEDVKGVMTAGVKGRFSAEDALRELLKGTALTISTNGSGVFAIRPAAASSGKRAAIDRAHDVIVGAPEILVTGSRSLNMDKPRSRDDAQPYVILGRDAIASSGAVNIGDFLKERLPMNSTAATMDQTNNVQGNLSQINLRGLGTGQTLILIDGHRTANVSNSTPLQPNLNGIPLSAIERIEVLPTTASAIYGGGATGGVVNVILRRDFEGGEVKLAYENNSSFDSAIRRLEATFGDTFNGGRTSVLVAASTAHTDPLLNLESDIVNQARRTIANNNPSFFFGAADPLLGATTNIRSVSGAPLFGPGTSNFTYVAPGYAGGRGRDPLRAQAGTYNFDLADTAQTPSGGRALLFKEGSTNSFWTSVRHEFSSRFQMFAEFVANDDRSYIPSTSGGNNFTVAANAPNNPFGQAIRVSVPLVGYESMFTTQNSDRRALAGLIFKLPGRWQGEVDYTWSRTHLSILTPITFTTAFAAAVQAGTIDVLRDTNAYPLNLDTYIVPRTDGGSFFSTLKDVTARAAGPVINLPAGPAVLSALVEHREEDLGETITPTVIFPPKSQSVDSAYTELTVPLVGEANRRTGIHRFDIQVAGRFDDYKVTGTTGAIVRSAPTPVASVTSHTRSTNPMIGLRYEPSASTMLRASWGTGFLPPAVNQLLPTRGASVAGTGAFDPRRNNEPVSALTNSGGNPDLKPEESKSMSLGMVLTPQSVSGARLSVDYTRIRKTDNILSLTAQQTIDNEGVLPGRVTRAAVAPGSPFAVGPITVLDRSLINLASSKADAIDLAIDYALESRRAGMFRFFALATRQIHFETQIISSLPTVENVGITNAFPLKFRGNAGVTWRLNNYGLGWIVRYFDSYVVAANPTTSGEVTVRSQGGERVPSQSYHDIYASYRWERNNAFLSGVDFQLGIKNLFNRRPPLDASNTVSIPYLYSPFGDARGVVFYGSIKAAF